MNGGAPAGAVLVAPRTRPPCSKKTASAQRTHSQRPYTTTMTGANHHNGLKTAILMGGLWSLLLLFGWVLAKGTGSSI